MPLRAGLCELGERMYLADNGWEGEYSFVVNVSEDSEEPECPRWWSVWNTDVRRSGAALACARSNIGRGKYIAFS